jgi:hypothetical protein
LEPAVVVLLIAAVTKCGFIIWQKSENVIFEFALHWMRLNKPTILFLVGLLCFERSELSYMN